jgi:hypothetical protein
MFEILQQRLELSLSEILAQEVNISFISLNFVSQYHEANKASVSGLLHSGVPIQALWLILSP